MNGSDIKKAAISKAKQAVTAANNAANGNGGKKRRKGGDLKPIITTEDQQKSNASPQSASNMNSSRSAMEKAQLCPYMPSANISNAVQIVLPRHCLTSSLR